MSQRQHELNKFNTFQYYYDPPDMPLDPKLVESIINDNDTKKTDNQTNENKTNKEDSGVYIYIIISKEIFTFIRNWD